MAGGMAARKFQFIDVSGVGNAGKSAVVDLLREFDGVWAPQYSFELDVLRVPGGLLDLRHSLLEDWSPIRSNAAFQAFLDVVRKMGADPKWWDIPGLMESTSQRYDRFFNGQFTKASEQFAHEFVIASYRAEWPYDGLRDGPLNRFLRKVMRRLSVGEPLLRKVYMLDGADFDSRAAAYLNDLYAQVVGPDCTRVVLNNGFEPFHPQPGLDMLDGARQIAVTRDPRDVYVTGLQPKRARASDASLLAFNNKGTTFSFLANDDIALFIQRYRLYRQKLSVVPDPRILQVGFEDLVHDYDRTVKRITEFIGIEARLHLKRQTHFDPNRSSKNVGVWQRYSKQEEIRYIESELAQYLTAE